MNQQQQDILDVAAMSGLDVLWRCKVYAHQQSGTFCTLPDDPTTLVCGCKTNTATPVGME